MNPTKLADFPVESIRQGAEVNIVVGAVEPHVVELMFGDLTPEEIYIEAPRNITWPQLLAALGCFPSTTQAKKNWCHGMKREAEINWGYQEVSIGKARKIFIFLFKERPEDP